MQSYPTKLKRYLNGLLPPERQAKEQLFERTLLKARAYGLQSPRFWAMRQVLSGLNADQIDHKIRLRTKGKPILTRDSHHNGTI